LPSKKKTVTPIDRNQNGIGFYLFDSKINIQIKGKALCINHLLGHGVVN
jgi:hypothetical protein